MTVCFFNQFQLRLSRWILVRSNPVPYVTIETVAVVEKMNKGAVDLSKCLNLFLRNPRFEEISSELPPQ